MAIRSTREDFLLQELRKVAAMIARAAGLRSSGDLPAARAEIKEAYALLLGPQAALLRMLDPVSAARLVPDPKRLAALVELTDAEAELRGWRLNSSSKLKPSRTKTSTDSSRPLIIRGSPYLGTTGL